MNLRFKWFCFILVFTGILGLTGCNNNLVTIHYSQPANAYVFDQDPTGSPHTTTSASNGMFMIYCIGQIENHDTNAKDFNLKLSKLHATNDPADVSGSTSLDQWVKTASDQTVKAGTTSPKIGRIIVRVDGDPTTMKNQPENLFYSSSSGESVLLVREGGNSPKFLDPLQPNNVPSCQ